MSSHEETPLKMIDICARLCDNKFYGVYKKNYNHPADFDSVLKRAKTTGVETIILQGFDLNECKEIAEFVGKSFDSSVRLHLSLGLHPAMCHMFTKRSSVITLIQDLKQLIASELDKVVAIGKCGLDFSQQEDDSKETQILCFIEHIKLAEEFKLPLMLLENMTNGLFLELLKAHREKFSTGVVCSFKGSIEEAMELIDLNLYIGISGSSLTTQESLEVVSMIPLDRILLESDSPSGEVKLTHKSYSLLLKSLIKCDTPAYTITFSIQKKNQFVKGDMVKDRNEPCYLLYLVHILAEIHQLPLRVTADTLFKTSERFFFGEVHSNSEMA